MPTALGPVSRRLHDARARRTGASAATTFVIGAPDGSPLLDASVAPSDLAAARARLRRTVVALAIAVVAFTVLLLAGPVLDARGAARSGRREWRLTLAILGVMLAGAALLWLAFTIAPWSEVRVNRTAFRLLLGGVAAAALSATIVSAALRLRLALRSPRRSPHEPPLLFLPPPLAPRGAPAR